MRPLQARCHLSLGRVHRLAGARASAETALTTARQRLGALRMAMWSGEAERELAELAGHSGDT